METFQGLGRTKGVVCLWIIFRGLVFFSCSKAARMSSSGGALSTPAGANGPTTPKKGPPKFKQRTTRTFKSKAPRPGQKGYVSSSLSYPTRRDTHYVHIAMIPINDDIISHCYYHKACKSYCCLLYTDLVMTSQAWRVLAQVCTFSQILNHQATTLQSLAIEFQYT